MSLLEPVVGRLVGDSTDYVRSLNEAEGRTKGMVDTSSRHFGGLKTVIGGVAASMAGLGAGIAVKNFLGGAIQEAEEARRTLALTNNVIQSTGGVAGVTAKDVGALADRLSVLTGIDDEVIAQNENMLLTFTNVRNGVGKGNDIFNQASSAVNDLAIFMNKGVREGADFAGASVQLGKALNDPIKGVTALRKVGVSFTDQQQDMIKSLVESGDVMGAQKIILREMASEFGGAAAATASPIDRLKVAWGNLQEQVGGALMPILASLATFLADRLPGAIAAAGQAFSRVKAQLAPVIELVHFAVAGLISAFSGEGITSDGFVGVMERIGVAARQVFEFIRDNAQPILIALGVAFVALTAPITGIAAALIYAYTQFDLVRTVVDAVVSFLTGTVLPAIATFVGFIVEQFTNLVGWVQQNWASIQEAIGHVIAVVQGIIEVFIAVVQAAWQTWGDEILNVATIIWDQIRNVVETAINLVRGIIETVVALINGDWGAAWDGIKGILATAWEFIRETVVNALRLVGQAVEGGLSGLVAMVGGVPGRVLGALGDLGSLLWNAGWSLMTGLLNGIKAAVQNVYNFVSGIAGKIASLKGPLDYDRRLLVPAGQAIMDGLVSGLRNHEGHLVNQLASITGMIGAVGGDVSVTGSASGGGVPGVAALSGLGVGAPGGRTVNISLQIVTATGAIPDETMRKIRAQLFEMENDLPSGSIVPG